jgi:hypothetical protein
MKHAAPEGVNAEHVEVVVRDQLHERAAALFAGGDLAGPAEQLRTGDDPRQRPAAPLQRVVRGEREGLGGGAVGAAFDQADQVVGLRDGQLPHEQRIDEAKHSRRAADAQHQRRDRRGGQDRPPAQQPASIVNVLDETFDPERRVHDDSSGTNRLPGW